jgi:GTP pyrophosphokinase/guanosine-3',5'-bis(diphosphate) 3'-pyrophosphohydrolase
MANTLQKQALDLSQITLPDAAQDGLRQLLADCHKYLDSTNDALVTDAFKLCFKAHDGIVRASGEPYYLHPLEVAEIVVKEIGIDDISVAAALLHDVVEDTDYTLDDIQQTFGAQVANLINGVTKISGVFKSKDARQAETFMKLLLTMAEDLRVVLIKFADRLHNMRTIGALPLPKQVGIARETVELYAPLAHRFGLFRIKSELEDLSFKVTDPNSYKFIARKLKEKKEDREKFIEAFMDPVRKKLDTSGFNFEIKGRPKHIHSIYLKMVRQGKPFEEVYDLFAIRIILDEPHTKEDCWRVYSIITDSYTPIPERFRDFISVPKANGYQSLHTTVITPLGRKVEVQIRTRKMDEIAERGLAAHWKYKEGTEAQTSIDRFMGWVREALENPRPEAATEFLQDFQLNLFTDEIYIFTPKGELKTLPSGATPIDFAFEIHSQVGERAIAAKVNGKIVPLRHRLNSGDQVEILTGKNVNLNPDWINDVVTHKAKARIRNFVKQQRRVQAEQGREIWEKRAEKGKVELDEQALTKVVNKLRFQSTFDLFADIGAGSYDVEQLFKAVKSYLVKGRFEDEKAAAPVIDETELRESFVHEARQHGDFRGLVINGDLTNVKYSYAKCCNPLPGDDVVGFVSRTGDIKIHRAFCKNVSNLLKNEKERVVDVAWSNVKSSSFIGAIRIVGDDRVGLINDITNVLSKTLKTNIKSINVSGEAGMFEGTLFVNVDSVDHLTMVVKKLETVDGVKAAYRFE